MSSGNKSTRRAFSSRTFTEGKRGQKRMDIGRGKREGRESIEKNSIASEKKNNT